MGERATAIAAGPRGPAGTRLDRVIADLGVMCAGAATTVYPTTEPQDAAHIIGDAGSKVVDPEATPP